MTSFALILLDTSQKYIHVLTRRHKTFRHYATLQTRSIIQFNITDLVKYVNENYTLYIRELGLLKYLAF